MMKFSKLDKSTGGWASSALVKVCRLAADCEQRQGTQRAYKSNLPKAKQKAHRQLLVEPQAQASEQLRNDLSCAENKQQETSNERIKCIGQKLNNKPKCAESEWTQLFAEADDQLGKNSTGACKRKSEIRMSNKEAQRMRRKSELTTFLTILFGCLAAVLLLFVQLPNLALASANNNSSAATVVVPAGVEALVTRTSNATEAGPPTSATETETTTATPPAITSTAESAADETDEERDETMSSTDEPETSERGKLGALINELAGSGTDLLVDRLRAGSKDEPLENLSDSSLAVDAEEDGAGETAATAAAAAAAAAAGSAPAQNSSAEVERERQLKHALQTYARWRTSADELIEIMSRKLLPLVVEHGYDVDAPTAAGLMQVFNGVRTLKPWALKLLDASAKLSAGLLVGTQSDFGDFDECLNVRSDDPSSLAASNPEQPAELESETGLKSTTLVGRYCLADVEFPKPPRELFARSNSSSSGSTTLLESMLRSNELAIDNKWAPVELRRPLFDFDQSAAFRETIFVETGNFFHMLYIDPIRVGLCLTNKIDPDAFATVLNKLLEEFQITINFHGRCVTKYDRPVWTSYQKISARVLVVVCLLVALSTACELLTAQFQCRSTAPRKLQTLAQRLAQTFARHQALLTSFSAIRNTKRLLRPQQAKQKQQQRAIEPSQPSDSSVESSPSVERRKSSSIDGGSSVELILNDAMSTGQRRVARLGAPTSSCASSASSDSLERTNSASSASSDACARRHAQLAEGANLQCLHGVRVITMTWMIVNHTYMFGGFFVLWAHRRLIDIAEWPKSLSFQLVLNGWLTVETYFFLSALIIVLNVMPLLKLNKFNYFAYVLHRLLRLLPAYIGLVCLNFLWPLISSGPVWLVKGKSFIQAPCENYLWTNFLFVNNWIWPEKQCMVHTWFLSADFQLYLVAPIVVYLLHRRPAIGHSLNLLIAILASILSGLVIYANDLLPTTLINKLEFDAIKQQLSYSYFATYQHMGPYCLGILTGYILHKRPDIRLPKHLTWLLWLILPPLSFTTLLLTYLWNGAYDEPSLINPSPLVSALYVAIHRIIWTSLIAWLVFACSTGRANAVSSFLSHSIFVPISRLSYSIYLVHFPVIMFRALNLRSTIEWSDQDMLWEACGNMVASVIMGFFVNIAFESPVINIEGALFRRKAIAQTKHNNLAHVSKGAFHSSAVKDSAKETPPAPSETNNINLPQVGNISNTSEASSMHQQKASMSTAPPTERHRSLLFTEHTDKLGKWPERRAASQRKPTDLRLIGSNARSTLSDTDSANRNSSNLAPRRATRAVKQASSQKADIYNVNGEYCHYAPGSYQQWRLTNLANSSKRSRRPQQYATLARTDRLASLRLAYPPSHPISADLLGPALDDERVQTRTARDDYVGPLQSVARPISVIEWAGTELYREQRAPTNPLRPISRRQGRYNTLTGTGHDWPAKYLLASSDPLRMSTRALSSDNQGAYYQNWPKQFSSAAQDSAAESILDSAGARSLQGDWLKPGAMIPRIDSSTLRRQVRRTEPTVADSIVEEPTAEESSAL